MKKKTICIVSTLVLVSSLYAKTTTSESDLMFEWLKQEKITNQLLKESLKIQTHILYLLQKHMSTGF